MKTSAIATTLSTLLVLTSARSINKVRQLPDASVPYGGAMGRPDPRATPAPFYGITVQTQNLGTMPVVDDSSDGTLFTNIPAPDVVQSIAITQPDSNNVNCYVNDASGNTILSFGGSSGPNFYQFDSSQGSQIRTISCALQNIVY